MDRQGIFDNLNTIEITAKLLVTALTQKDSIDDDLAIRGAHREELISQTADFLSQAQKLVIQLSSSCNLPTETLFESRVISSNDASNGSFSSRM
jgi:hypothetical protein